MTRPTITYEELLQDITYPPVENARLISPYRDNMDKKQKFDLAYRALRRTIKTKSRIIALMNAYYLGLVLDEMDFDESHKFRKKMSQHYLAIVTKTFDLFEPYPTQILTTKILSTTEIRLIDRPDITQARNELYLFAGAPN